MKIVVNTRLLLKDRLEGIGVFTYECLKRITAAHPEHEFVFVFDRPFSEEFIFSKNVLPVIAAPKARHPFLFYYWFEFVIPRILKEQQADLFLSPDGFLSLSTQVRSLAVIHDLNFEHGDFGLPFLVKKYYRHYFPLFAKKATRIATVSEFSKNDISALYQVSKDQIDVVYNSAAEGFKPLPDEEKRLVRQKYSSSKSYFLFVGALHQRKNISNLLLAFDVFKTRTSSDVKLVLAGNKKWWDKQMEDTFSGMRFRSDVVFTGRLPQDELCRLTASALALTYIPFFEGFGIPVVEAMCSDVPVIASNTSSLPEVCGDATLLVDPESVESVSEAMNKIYSDSDLRATLVEKAKLQRQKFSWDKSASLLWSCMEKVMLK